MASFIEELWNSIFTPGTTPTLLVATNASFAALQALLLVLLLVTYSIHFFILSLLCAGLWYAINWFARELQIEKDRLAKQGQAAAREKPADAGNDSDTETEMAPHSTSPELVSVPDSKSSQMQPAPSTSGNALRHRRSLGDSSGYVSTDSEWEKVSGG